MGDQFQIQLQIAQMRKKKGVTQEELANHLGVSYQAVSKWENGNAFPDISLLPAIAQYFGESIEAVLGLHPVKKAPSDTYDAIKAQLSACDKSKLYDEAWNLSAVLFEALATKGWKEYVPWDVRNRLNESNGYHGWGMAMNIEKEGYSFLSGGMTVIGLNNETNLPKREDISVIHAFLSTISDKRLLLLLLTWLEVYKAAGENTPKNIEELSKMTSLSADQVEELVNRLIVDGWVAGVFSPANEGTKYILNKALGMLPVFALLKTLVCDLRGPLQVRYK